MEKCGNFGKNIRFSGRIWPDLGNTAWADMAGFGSIGLTPRENANRINEMSLIEVLQYHFQSITLSVAIMYIHLPTHVFFHLFQVKKLILIEEPDPL